MTALYFFKVCFNFFYCNSTNQTQKTPCYAMPVRSASKPVEMKANFCYAKQNEKFSGYSSNQSFKTKNFTARVVCHSTPTFYPVVTPLTFHPVVPKNSGVAQPSSRPKTQEALLSQSLQNQINQLDSENKATLAKISMKRSERTHSRSICPLSILESTENMKKHTELTKLNIRLKNISDFCNEEMITVLSFVTEGCTSLDKKLAVLRKECASIEDDALLYETIEHIAFLEKIDESLHQLEAKFQHMQKGAFRKTQINKTSQDKQEAHVSSLLEKIEKLNEQKQFLDECKQKLPAHKAYDVEELKGLIKLFENEKEDLSQKTKETRQKYNQAKQFGDELTNHLLDYAELFKDYVQKLKIQSSSPVLAPSKQMTRKPLVSKDFMKTSLSLLPSTLKATPEDGINSNELNLAAVEVAKALKDLLEITSG